MKGHVTTVWENNESVQIKSEIGSIDLPLNEVGDPMVDTCSVYIEDPILLTMKHEDQVHSEQCTDNSEALEFDHDTEQMKVESLSDCIDESDEDYDAEEYGDASGELIGKPFFSYTLISTVNFLFGVQLKPFFPDSDKVSRHEKTDDDYVNEMDNNSDDKEDEYEDNDGDNCESTAKTFGCGICRTAFINETYYKRHIVIHGSFTYNDCHKWYRW